MAHTFLLPTDFSKASEVGVDAGVELAEKLGASVVLIHVWDSRSIAQPPITVGWSPAQQERLTADIRKGIEANLEALRTRVAERVSVTAELADDRSSARAVTRYAEEHGIHLIVVATHGRTGLEHFLVGSVAEKIVRFAKCRVLTVPAGDLEE